MNTTSLPMALKQVLTASKAGESLFSTALSAQPGVQWVDLDAETATKAYIELDAALGAVRELVSSLEESASTEFKQYLDRADNSLNYSLASINEDGSKARAHSGRATSSVRQLKHLADLSEQLLEKLGKAVVKDIAQAMGLDR